MQFSFDPELREIADKVEDGERLTFAEGVALYNSSDLNAVGKLADFVRRKKHGLTTYYNVNRHFNHTNICVADCKFCGFYRRSRAEDAYTHSVTEALEIARAAVAEGATELHIVGGGARNELLCRWTASACGRPVQAGPEEATLIGNLLVQAMALGEVESLEAARDVVRASFEPTIYEPTGPTEWSEARRRFAEIVVPGLALEVGS